MLPNATTQHQFTLRGADEVAASRSVMLMHCQRELEYERHMKRLAGHVVVAERHHA